MRVRLKIQHDPDWKPQLRLNQRYWVYLPDGQYFAIFTGHCGQWYQMFAQHMDYPCAEQALAAAIQHIYAKWDKLEQWRKCRAKEQVFTFHDRKHSRLKLPRERKPAQPQPARKA